MTKILIFLLFTPFFAIGQKIITTERGGQENVYYDAIQHFSCFLTNSDSSLNKIYFQKSDLLQNDSSFRTKRANVVFIGADDIEKKAKIDTVFILYKIYPLSMDSGKFYVKLVPFDVAIVGEKLTYKSATEFRITYSFDCSKARLKYNGVLAIDY